MESSERRTNERAKLETQVRIDSETQFFAGVTGNVGRGGLFVATYALLPVGTAVTVEFTMPNERTVVAGGTVGWLRETEGAIHGMGVVFDELKPEDEHAIREFCAVRPPLVHDMAMVMTEGEPIGDRTSELALPLVTPAE